MKKEEVKNQIMKVEKKNKRKTNKLDENLLVSKNSKK